MSGCKTGLTAIAFIEAIAAVNNSITFRIFLSNTDIAGTPEGEAGTRHHWKAITHGLLSTWGWRSPSSMSINLLLMDFYLGFGWAWQAPWFPELWRFLLWAWWSSCSGWFC